MAHWSKTGRRFKTLWLGALFFYIQVPSRDLGYFLRFSWPKGKWHTSLRQSFSKCSIHQTASVVLHTTKRHTTQADSLLAVAWRVLAWWDHLHIHCFDTVFVAHSNEWKAALCFPDYVDDPCNFTIEYESHFSHTPENQQDLKPKYVLPLITCFSMAIFCRLFVVTVDFNIADYHNWK